MRVLLALIVAVAFSVAQADDAPTTVAPIGDALAKNLKTCCEGMGVGDKLDCEALSRNKHSSVAPSPELFNFVFKCIAKSKDNTPCCKAKNVTDECLPLCNAKNPPSVEEIRKMGAGCEPFLKTALGFCATGGKERLFGGLFSGALGMAGSLIGSAWGAIMPDSINRGAIEGAAGAGAIPIGTSCGGGGGLFDTLGNAAGKVIGTVWGNVVPGEANAASIAGAANMGGVNLKGATANGCTGRTICVDRRWTCDAPMQPSITVVNNYHTEQQAAAPP
jgi:hypothetical protein